MFWQSLANQLAVLISAALEATLLRPFSLPPGVTAMWGFMRDTGLAVVSVALTYGAVRASLAAAGGQSSDPWLLLPRAALAAAGCQLSLALVQELLLINNQLVAAVIAAAQQPLTAPLVGPVMSFAALSAITAGVANLVVSGGMAAVLALGLLWMAVVYLIRAAEIVFLTLAAPVVAALCVIPQAADAWRVWLGELCTAVFLQSAQVLVLWAVVVLGPWGGMSGSAAGALESLLEGIASLVLLSRVRALLRQLAGLLGPAPAVRLGPVLERLLPAGQLFRGVRA